MSPPFLGPGKPYLLRAFWRAVVSLKTLTQKNSLIKRLKRVLKIPATAESGETQKWDLATLKNLQVAQVTHLWVALEKNSIMIHSRESWIQT